MKTLSAKMIAPVVEIIHEILEKLDVPEKSREDIILDIDKLGFGDIISTGSKFEKKIDFSEYELILE